MMRINAAEAELPKLVELLETGQETRIVLERDGKPVARMERCQDEPDGKPVEGKRIKFGIAKGELNYSGDFDACNDEIAEMFGVGA